MYDIVRRCFRLSKVFAVIFARISKLLQRLTVKMPKVIVNLTDTQIRSSVNSHRKLLTKVQIKLADGKGLFFYY